MSRSRDSGRPFAAWFFPARASTQTWMILTFVLFIGIAVVSVGLYVGFIVRAEIQSTMRQTLQRDAARLAVPLDSDAVAADSLLLDTLVRQASASTGLRITVVQPDGHVVDYDAGRPVSDPTALSQPEIAELGSAGTAFQRRTVGEKKLLFASIHRPDSDAIVRVGQEEPPLFVLLQRLQLILVVAMVMALLLSILGAWIAAQRVTEPLQAIRNSARAISEGGFENAIVVDSRAAEFQDLAASLNRMSDSFRETIGDLQRLATLQNEFIGNVSHEVRNPIFAVGGYLEALATPALTDNQRRFYAEKGLANLNRLNNLFNDLIEIARLEYREDMIRTDVFDLQELVDDIADLLQSKADEKQLELIADNPQVFVNADRNRIRQVLVNLVDNAIAYSDEGTVRCRFRRHLNKVRVEVVDTGRGIPDEHRDRIFERFYRVDPDRSRKSGGTGLGLSIVKQILAAHGEAIHVESTPGRGTRFWFELPFAPTPSPENP